MQAIMTMLFFFAQVVFFGTSVAKHSPPHIIVIVADDLGWNDVGFHGSGQIPTPNIDNFAKDGIILNNYYVDPICTPSRSALMTGRYPIHTGMWHGVIVAPQPYGLSLNDTIIPQYLKKLNYTTHAIGKWHLGFFKSEYTPTKRGFDSYFGYYCGKSDYFSHLNTWAGATGLDLHKNLTVDRADSMKYSTDLYGNEASRIIMQHDSRQPLFMYLAHQAVHSANTGKDPLQAPQHYIDRVKHIKHPGRQKFAAMLVAMDDSIGLVKKALVARNMLSDTLVVFTTDNGGPAHGFDWNFANNWPLRGVKDTLWEGGIRAAGFIWSKRLSKAQYTSNHLMHITDWLPTLYRAAGGDPNKDLLHIDGHDLWLTLSKNRTSSPRRTILHNIDNIRGIAALRMDNYKVILGESYGKAWNKWYAPEDVSAPDLNKTTVRCGEPPANVTTNCLPSKAPCLYDVINDPCEYFNLADSHPSVLAQLLKELAAFNKTVVPTRRASPDPASDPAMHGGAWVPWLG